MCIRELSVECSLYVSVYQVRVGVVLSQPCTYICTPIFIFV